MQNITQTTQTDEHVFNGTRVMHANDEFFMTELKVREILSKLKVKNCEGIDRIPLRILNEGAEILYKPLSKLFQLIYETKVVPEQWKIAKIIPTHKKGAKDNVENYRPISNLCAISKIYEKLILGHLWDLANSENIDLTGENQHGFKKNRSTTTVSQAIQSALAGALD